MILLWNAAVLTCPINSNRGSEIIKKNVGDLRSRSCWIKHMEPIHQNERGWTFSPLKPTDPVGFIVKWKEQNGRGKLAPFQNESGTLSVIWKQQKNILTSLKCKSYNSNEEFLYNLKNCTFYWRKFIDSRYSFLDFRSRWEGAETLKVLNDIALFFGPAYAVQHESKYLYLLSLNPLIYCKAKTA